MLKDNQKIRDAVHEAFREKCFYSGRPVSREEMVIDHVIPISEGGKDCIENYALTFADLNSGKHAKLDEALERMAWTVRKVYAPRVHDALKRKNIVSSKNKKDVIRIKKIKFKQFHARHKQPDYQQLLKKEDLVWSGDDGLRIVSASPAITEENQEAVMRKFRDCIAEITEWEIEYSIDL